jgi:hypothetical protein
LVLVACSEPPGLSLEVIPLDDSIEYVEVYLADHCDECPDSMAAPMMRAHMANIFETEYSEVFSASKSEAKKWKDGHALFRITSRVDQDDYLGYMLIIGFDANRTPKAINRFSGVTIPKYVGEYWQVELDEPVTPLTDAPSNEERIAIWGMNRTGPKCVLVVNGDGRADGVVPADDPDCDGQTPQHECAPYMPNAVNVAPNIDHASCVTTAYVPATSTGATGYVCLLGGLPCTEGVATQGCAALDVDYCVPMRACGCGSDIACIATKLTDPDVSVTVHELCTVSMQLDGKECADSSKRETEIDLSGLLTSGGGTKCTSIRVHDLTLPFGPFVDKLDLRGATLELGNFQQPCLVTMKWSGDYERSLGPQTLALDVALDNGKHLVLPFLVRGTDNCTNATSCRLSQFSVDTETMFACTKPAVDTTTCITTNNSCPNATAACGGRCCGPGERCVDGQCRCGDGTHCGEGTCYSSGDPSIPMGCGDVCCPDSMNPCL